MFTLSIMDFIAFDLETTGVKADRDCIVEIGAVKFINGEPQKAYSTLIDPECPIPPDATRVNGITDEMVSGQPLIQEVLSPFADYCGDLPLVAHNAKFDYGFMLHTINKHQAKAPRGIVLDSYMLAKRVIPGLANYRLGSLVHHFRIPSTQFHRAEEDAAYCGLVFHKIVTRLEDIGHATDINSLRDLMGIKELTFPVIVKRAEQLGLF